ncbi:MAG: hypothetical protein NWE92_06790 [Candidatus Bathyarchaeota archaeon]|nr:hypothetical protein [Candidatus Bathyarchaeota archaeon]
MPFGKTKESFKLSAGNVILLASAFIWYLIAFNALKGWLEGIDATNLSLATNNTILVFGVNLSAIILSSLLGSFIVDKLKGRQRFLFVWLSLGIVLSLAPIAFTALDLNSLVLVSLIFGLYFGIGMPATMGFHSSLVETEDRAKVGGLTFLIIGVSSALVSLLIFDNFILTCLALALVKVIGLIIFLFMRRQEQPYTGKKTVHFKTVVGNKSFLLYFFPWLMITLINYMTLPILISNPESNYNFFSSWEYVIVAITAVISGFIADRWGRKRLTIIGFVMLGIGYAVVGLTSDVYPFIGTIIYTITDGITWGIFNVLFLFTLWGDLAQGNYSDKFYFLGALPFLSSYVIQLFFTPLLSGISLGTIFSFASVFLFIAILPLIYAPETLSEKTMKDRDLKNYIENAQKKVQKESQKIKQKPQDDTEASPEEEPSKTENSKEFEEARKLAEKYY